MRKHWKVKESSLLLLCFLNIKTVFGGSEPKQLNVVPPREIPGIEEVQAEFNSENIPIVLF